MNEMAQAVNRKPWMRCADYQTSAFKPREKTIDDFWQSDAVTHAVEDMIQCWSDVGYAINALMTPV